MLTKADLDPDADRPRPAAPPARRRRGTGDQRPQRRRPPRPAHPARAGSDDGPARHLRGRQVDPGQHPARRGAPGDGAGPREGRPWPPHHGHPRADRAARRRPPPRHPRPARNRPLGRRRPFDDIDRLAAGCRFNDCAHLKEPGCAVRGAVPPDRLAAWRQLAEERAASPPAGATSRSPADTALMRSLPHDPRKLAAIYAGGVVGALVRVGLARRRRPVPGSGRGRPSW